MTVMFVIICLSRGGCCCCLASRGKTQTEVIVLTSTSAMWLVYKTEMNNLLFRLRAGTVAKFRIFSCEIKFRMGFFLVCLHFLGSP